MIRKFLGKIIYRFIAFCFLYPFFKLFGRLEVKGIENIPKSGGILIASNHLSYVDPPLLATIIPGGCVFMAKDNLLKIPILRHIIGYYSFPVNRQKPGASAIKTALTKLAHGEIVVIFPEGRRGTGNALLPFKKGIGIISVLSGKKVVPTLIEGSDKLFSLNKFIPRPAKVRVTFGMPIDLSQEGTDYNKISHKIADSIRELTQLDIP